MTTTLTAHDPADLLAVVPVVLGFHPCDSLVMLTFDAPHQFHARVDLPPPPMPTGSLATLVETLLAPAVAHHVGRVAFVVYSGHDAPSARLGVALHRAFVGEGIGVVDMLRAHAGAWRRLPSNPGHREGRPQHYDIGTHPFAAQAVFDGLVTHASRDAVRDSVATDPTAVARVLELQAGSSSRPGPDLPWVLEVVARCAATGERPSEAEAAHVLAAVSRRTVRDAALFAVKRETAVGHLAVWCDLLRRAPDAQVPDAAALVAFCAWQVGQGALAWCALDRGLEIDPDHRLARYLGECLTRAVAPSAWDRSAAAGQISTGAPEQHT